jgi:hypothetical protein
MKWGERYGPEYVNRLQSMIQRNTKRDTRLTCFTDDASNIRPEVRCLDLPPINLPSDYQWKPWRKISLWQKPLADFSGDILFLDLDLIVTGDIDCFFDHDPGKFYVIRNWPQYKERIGNTSVYRFTVGAHSYLYHNLMNEPDRIFSTYPNSQTYISREIREINFWPDEWCKNFKFSLLPKWPMRFFKTAELPPDLHVVCFTGKPDPEDAVVGKWPEKKIWKKIYKYVRPTPWIAEHWR